MVLGRLLNLEQLLHVINGQSEPDGATVLDELTDIRGVEKIVEVVGPETFRDSIQAAATDGEIALVGFLGQSDKKFGYFDLFRKANVRSVSVGSRTDLEEMNQLIEATELTPVVDRVFSFNEAKEAF